MRKNNKNLISDFRHLGRLWPYTKGNRKFLIVPLITIPLTALVQIGQPLMLKRGIDLGIMSQEDSVLWWSATAFFGLVVLEYLSRLTQALASTTLVQRLVANLRKKLVDHVLKLKARFHDKNLSGALVTRATSDFDNLGDSLATGVLNTVVDLAVLISAIVTMFALQSKLAVFCILFLPVVTLLVSVCSKALKAAMLASRKVLAALNGFTQEALFGQQTLKILGAKRYANSKYEGMAEEFEKKQMKSVTIDASLFSLLDGIASVALGGVLFKAIGIEEPVSAGTLVAFVRLIQQMFDPLKQLGSTMTMLQGVFTSCERIFGLLETKEFIEGSEELNLKNGEIEVKNLSFSYANSEASTIAKTPGESTSFIDSKEKIIKDVTFKIPAKSSLAIIGRTGSGKSTLVKLFSKSYDGYEGSILIDQKHELKDIAAESLRSQIAIVTQDIVIFETTVRENVRLFREDISDSTIWEALRKIGAGGFIEAFPDGLDHILINQGAELSQGQRQLLAFSRALCFDPKIIILDEATSSIDPQSELLVKAATEKLISGRTMVIIAHRLETIRNCDSILVLDKGKKIEQGNHQALLEKNGAYAAFLGSST